MSGARYRIVSTVGKRTRSLGGRRAPVQSDEKSVSCDYPSSGNRTTIALEVSSHAPRFSSLLPQRLLPPRLLALRVPQAASAFAAASISPGKGGAASASSGGPRLIFASP